MAIDSLFNTAQEDAAVDGMTVVNAAVTDKTIAEALATFHKYKEGKAHFDNKIVQNEEWYRLRHWRVMKKGDKTSEVQPASAWLLNSILSKHADSMDNFPEPNILPREESDKAAAEILTSVIPVLLEQNDFEETYYNEQFTKLKTGTGVYQVKWDGGKLNGLGDISVTEANVLQLFWKPGVTDIQKSPNLFYVELVDNDEIKAQYPQIADKNLAHSEDTVRYYADDNIDTSDMTPVFDWYYKKSVNGRKILHYCKFVPGYVLFATENEPESYPNGWFDHGQYPFVLDVLYPIADHAGGFGVIDIGKDTQAYIDVFKQALTENTLANCKPRYFMPKSAAINRKQFLDLTDPYVEYEGNPQAIQPIQSNPINAAYITMLANSIEELKETTGNRDIQTGGSQSGVTAASAIAAMQEAGGKLSRDSTKAAFRAYRQVIYQVIELIRQFYTVERTFRIVGAGKTEMFVTLGNGMLTGQPQEAFGLVVGQREPIFDIDVIPQKQSPYSKMAQNELALQFYTAGFFNPAMAEQALSCIEMMDFTGKDDVVKRIQQNNMAYQQAMLAAAMAGVPPEEGSEVPARTGGTANQSMADNSVTAKARRQAAETTAPR